MGEGGRDSGLAEFVYEAIKDRIELSKEEFIEKVADWDIKPFYVKGEIAAAVMLKENEIHVASSEKHRGKWISRRAIKEILGTVLDEYGEVVTSVSYGNDSAAAFVERLGFVPDRTTYILRELKHAR